MNSIHDLGGMDGFGPVQREAAEPVFHADWERRMLALALAVPFAVPFGDDHLRREIERIEPARYLRMPYYEKWLIAIGALLRERGILDGRPTVACAPAVAADKVFEAIAGGFPTRRAETIRPRFVLGDRVRARNLHPAGHTRLPRYARGRVGEIVADRGVFGFPDSNAEDRGPKPQHCYGVRFSMTELWGEGAAGARDRLYLDLWEDYLEPA